MAATVKWVDEALSTNDLIEPEASHGQCVAARAQSAGRGQRGNSWESEPGKNLTFSICLRPRTISPDRQFELSMVVALAVCDCLREFTELPDWLKLKWPNDIYYADRKLGGILIEQVVCKGQIVRSVVGIGINVNQSEFHSNAPNPVSLLHIIGHELALEPLLQCLADGILAAFDAYEAEPDPAVLMERYRSCLWRGDRAYPFRDSATGRQFMACIAGIAPDGPIMLLEGNGNARTYNFKEVEFVL